MQTNWIGRSEGAFKNQNDEIVIFTTRPDTLWGVTRCWPRASAGRKADHAERREAVYSARQPHLSEIERVHRQGEDGRVYQRTPSTW